MPSVTIRRLDAVQRWPVWKNAPSTAQVTAVSRSASSSTTSGFLPPISHCTGIMRAMARLRDSRPVGTEPVNEIASTPSMTA